MVCKPFPLISLVMLLVLTAPCRAEQDVRSKAAGLYLAAGAVRADYDIPNLTDSTGYNLSIGIKFNARFALEANYQDLGGVTHQRHSELGGTRWELQGESRNLLLRMSTPVLARGELFLEGGYHELRLDLEESGIGVVAQSREEDWLYGAGATLTLSRLLAVGFRYHALTVSSGHMGVWGAFVRYIF